MQLRYVLAFFLSTLFSLSHGMDDKIAITPREVLESPEMLSIITFLKKALEKQDKVYVSNTTIEENITYFPGYYQSGSKDIQTTKLSISKNDNISIELVISIKTFTEMIPGLTREEAVKDNSSDD